MTPTNIRSFLVQMLNAMDAGAAAEYLLKRNLSLGQTLKDAIEWVRRVVQERDEARSEVERLRAENAELQRQLDTCRKGSNNVLDMSIVTQEKLGKAEAELQRFREREQAVQLLLPHVDELPKFPKRFSFVLEVQTPIIAHLQDEAHVVRGFTVTP